MNTKQTAAKARTSAKTNPLALPQDRVAYFLGEFRPDATGQLVQVKTCRLTEEHIETIRYALSFHLGYCEDTAADVEEMEIADESWHRAAIRDRRALAALQMKVHDPDPMPEVMEESREESEGFAARAGRRTLWLLDQGGKALVLLVLLLVAVLIGCNIH